MNIKPVARKEAYWAAMADDTITPPEPQTTEECILAAMSGNYPVEDIKPQTREQALMKAAAEKICGSSEPVEVVWTSATLGLSDKTALTSVVIPDGVMAIADEAFMNYSDLESVTIPKGVTTIGSDAFSGCKSLKSITIPDGVTTTGSGAFGLCSSLESIIIPASVTTMIWDAFYGCTALKTATFLCSNSININGTIFDGCTVLADIYVPWSEGEVAGAPWGATNATIHYNYTGGEA